MWAYKSIFYQISTLGFCGAPIENDGVTVNRIKKVDEWIPHIKKLGANAIYFCPVFSSDKHGYDTRDYKIIDCRLGTNQDFENVCTHLHENDIKVVLDGVFNHVGRGFFGFQDMLKKRENSIYKDWFINVNFGANDCYNDGLSYEGWEGHMELVKLNLRNEDVINYLFECIDLWIDEFKIDGIRLDVAYSLDIDFVKRLRNHVDSKQKDFYLLGEMIHGDYNRLLDQTNMLHSVTNYQAYKGMWSSFNDLNMFEINYTLEQHFCGSYIGKHLLNFLDNHDVNRLASTLTDKNHIPIIYQMMFALPGIPCIYYGSEWGINGRKEDGGDEVLRPCLNAPEWNELCDTISQVAQIYKSQRSLCYGDYQKVYLTNKQLVFKREFENEKIYVAINIENDGHYATFSGGVSNAVDLLTGKELNICGGIDMAPYSIMYLYCK